MLLFKLLVTPAVVALATLAGRRFGRIASGWLIGLPLTSGPLMVFLALEHGSRFAARAAVGSLGGAICEVGFCLGYAFTVRRRGWPAGILTGSIGFAAAAVVLETIPLGVSEAGVATLAACAVAALLAGLALLPHVPVLAQPRLPSSRWDIPARAVLTTAILLVLTALATTFGPRLSGVLAVYPLYTAVLAVFAQRHVGAGGALQVLRGLLLGLFSFVCFFATLAVGLIQLGTAAGFALSIAAALAVQAASLRPLLRLAAA